MKYVLASACAEYGMKNTMKECIKNWVMDISIFWANFISFVMSGTLNEERYKDLNSLDSLIIKKEETMVECLLRVFSETLISDDKLLLTFNSLV